MNCAVIDLLTKQQINWIVADPAEDLPPDGCMLVEVPNGYYWNGVAVVPQEVTNVNNN